MKKTVNFLKGYSDTCPVETPQQTVVALLRDNHSVAEHTEEKPIRHGEVHRNGKQATIVNQGDIATAKVLFYGRKVELYKCSVEDDTKNQNPYGASSLIYHCRCHCIGRSILDLILALSADKQYGCFGR